MKNFIKDILNKIKSSKIIKKSLISIAVVVTILTGIIVIIGKFFPNFFSFKSNEEKEFDNKVKDQKEQVNQSIKDHKELNNKIDKEQENNKKDIKKIEDVQNERVDDMSKYIKDLF